MGYKIQWALNKHFPELQHVKDAKKRLVVEVTARDRSAAKKLRHKECALALACRRQFHLDGVLIARSRAYLVREGTATRYELPMAIQKEVVSFDRGGGFDPGQYELLKPARLLGPGGGGRKRKSRSRTAKPRRRHLVGKVRVSIAMNANHRQ